MPDENSFINNPEPSGLEIRNVNPSDVETITAIHLAASRSWEPEYNYRSPEHGLEFIRSSLYHRTGANYLAEVANTPAGYSIVYVSSSGIYVLGSLYVLPEFQGRGVANSLLQKSLEWAGSKEVHLSAKKQNSRALRFYEKNGFKPYPSQSSDSKLIRLYRSPDLE